jgi:lipopolysaccharide biosynthesis protein
MASRSNLFKRHMFENLLTSRGYGTNVIDMFKARPRIGLAVPPIVQISFWTMGHSWCTNRTRAEELKKLLDLNVDFDWFTPVAVYGTMFWFRPPVLRKLFLHPWKLKEFNAEPNHTDGGLAHTLARLIAYVAQDASTQPSRL